MKERNDIDQLFRESFEDFSVTPPASLKTNIDKQLGKSDSRKIWIWLSVLVLLFSIGGIAYFVSSSKIDSSKSAVTLNSDNHQSSNKINPTTNEISQNSTDNPIEKNPRITKTTKNAEEKNENIKSTHPTVSIKHEYAKSTVAIQTKKINANQKLTSEKTEMNKVSNSNVFVSLKSNKLSKSTKSKKKSTTTTTSFNSVKNNSSSVGNPDQDDENAKTPLTKTMSSKAISDTKTDLSNSEIITSIDIKNTTTSAGIANTSKDSLVSKKVENKDSLKTEIAKQDSSQVPVQSKETPKKEIKNGNKSNENWLILLQGGISFAPKYSYESGSNERINTSTKPGFGVDLAFSRNINLGKLTYAGVNVAYGSYTNSNQYNYVNQQLYTPNDSIPIYDSTNTIIGYYYPTSDTLISSAANSNFSSPNTIISFGLQAQFDFNLSEKIGISITPAFRYALNSFKNSDYAFAAYKTQRLQFQLGLDLYYDWKQWRFMVGMNSRYLMNIKAPAFTYQERNRIQFIPQLGIGFKF